MRRVSVLCDRATRADVSEHTETESQGFIGVCDARDADRAFGTMGTPRRSGKHCHLLPPVDRQIDDAGELAQGQIGRLAAGEDRLGQ